MGLISDAAVSRGDVVRQQAEAERDMEAARSARRSERSSVGAQGIRFHSGGGATFDDGGGLVINGGTLRLVDEHGVTIAQMGRLGNGEIGWAFSSDQGRAFFTRQGDFGQQFWALWDGMGHIVVSSDAESEFGLARPWLPLPTPQPVGVSHWPSTQEPEFATVSRSSASAQHARIAVDLRAYAEPGTVGQVQFTVDGRRVGPVVDVADGSFGFARFEESIPVSVFGARMELAVQARRVSGGGRVHGTTYTIYGIQGRWPND